MIFSAISWIFSHKRGKTRFWEWFGRFFNENLKMRLPFWNEKIKKWNYPLTLTIRESCLNREFSSKTLRIQQTPEIVFSPRASFSRHPQYTPAPSVSAYRACSKLFAAPSIERERPVSVSNPSVCVSIPSLCHARTALWPGIPIKIKKNSYYICIYHSNRHLLFKSVNPRFSKNFNFFKFNMREGLESSEKMTSLVKLTYFLFLKRIMSLFI